MRPPPHPATADITLPTVMHALSDPARLRIVGQLARDGAENCGDIGESLALHKSTLSHHYRVLREAGVTLTTIEGRNRIVRLRRSDLDERFPGLLDSVVGAIDVAASTSGRSASR